MCTMLIFSLHNALTHTVLDTVPEEALNNVCLNILEKKRKLNGLRLNILMLHLTLEL